MFSVLTSAARVLYGDAANESTIGRAFVLSSLFFFLIGTYWQLRALKDSVFITIIGIEHMPAAKGMSVVVVSVLTVPYNKLVDLVPRHRLLGVLSLIYAALFVVTALCLASPSYGLYAPLAPSPRRLLGWAHYMLIESYGSLVVSCFWQYVNWASTYEDARAQYGIIVAGGQVGAFGGSTLVTASRSLGVPELCAFGGVLAALPVALMHVFKQALPTVAAVGAAEGLGGIDGAATPSVRGGGGRGARAEGGCGGCADGGGACEGAYLLLRYPYVLGIFAVSALHEVISTIMDFQMKVLATKRIGSGASKEHATEDMAAFLGFFGQATTTVSLLFSVLGTSFVVRRLGLRHTLLLFPVSLMIATAAVYAFQSRWALFFAMVAIKGLSYALNNPSKEMLYLVTSDGVKFKSKSWIDGFGNRIAKASGALVVGLFSSPLSALMFYGSLVSLAISSLVLVIAQGLGSTFERLHASGHLIGGATSIKAMAYDTNGPIGETVALHAGAEPASPRGGHAAARGGEGGEGGESDGERGRGRGAHRI